MTKRELRGTPSTQSPSSEPQKTWQYDGPLSKFDSEAIILLWLDGVLGRIIRRKVHLKEYHLSGICLPIILPTVLLKIWLRNLGRLQDQKPLQDFLQLIYRQGRHGVVAGLPSVWTSLLGSQIRTESEELVPTSDTQPICPILLTDFQ